MELFVHNADIQDPDGGRDVLILAKAEHPRLEKVRADGRYEGSFADWATDSLQIAIEVVHKLKDQVGFVVLARRWVVERPFAWLDKCLRLARYYEESPEATEAWSYLAMSRTYVRRLARNAN